MGYSKTVVILPGYGLDSLPYDIDDDQAEGLLNAFAAACHPQLLAAAERLPAWHSCDDYADSAPDTLFIIPPVSEDHLHGQWLDSGAETSGIIRGLTDRAALVNALLAECGVDPQPLDEELVGDCMAIGIAHAIMELLTQQMHYFTNIDEEVLTQNTIAAAQAIVDGDTDVARSKLTVAYESLVEARERFYPVDCYLIDLCLLSASHANAHLPSTLASGTPVNLLIEGNDLADFSTETIAAIREKLTPPTPDDAATVAILGGEFASVAAPLVPLETWLHDFLIGLQTFESHFGRTPRIWARKRFGFSTLLPQVLTAFGYRAALHVALDDGTYPDTEHSKLSWEGSDGTNIDALTRIPVAMDSASAFLRLPQRIAESMQEDMVAAVVFARLAEVRSPWLSDFQRMHKYGQVFGRFVTLEEFAEDSGDSGHHSRYEAREYLSPFLIQGSALGEARPISRFTLMHQQRSRLNAALACSAMVDLIQNTTDAAEARASLQKQIDESDEQQPVSETTEAAIADFTTTSLEGLTRICRSNPEDGPGVFVFNSLPFARRTVVDVPNGSGAAVPVLVDLPALGYVWTGPQAATADTKTPLASRTLLHNGTFEVRLNEDTGSIACIKGFGRSPNRMSQQLAFRYERPRAVGVDGNGDEIRSSYSEMRCRDITVLRCDQLVGEVETSGDLVDQHDDTRLAAFRQKIRVVRSSPFVDIEIEFSDLDHLPTGNPWLCYYCCRFAWDDAAAALTRSVFGQAHGFSGERFESPHYLEIASDDRRTTIIGHGLPFHRKTDLRMVDSLLVVEGEQERRFRFSIAIDQAYPMQAALHAMTPPLSVFGGKPATGDQGWFVNVTPRNVLITEFPQPAAGGSSSFCFRILETEGRAAAARLSCFRTPVAARKIDFLGNPSEELVVEPDGSVTIDLRKYELCDLQLDF